MIPSLDQIAAAQNAINSQHPALSRIPAGERVRVELDADELATISTALGVTSRVVLEGAKPTPAQVGWAAIMESALVARGGARFEREVLEALHHVEASTLERMACLVLAHASAPTVRASTSLETGKLTIEIGTPGDAPDTPETVAAKCIAARAVVDGFRERVVEPIGAKREAGR